MPELFNNVWIHSETENKLWNHDDKIIIDEVKSYHLPDWKINTAIDIGANFGAFVLLLKKLNPHCEIVAIEPEPSNFDLLDRNTRQWLDVWPVQGYAAENELGKLMVSPDHSGCHRMAPYGFQSPHYIEGPVVGPYNLEMLFAILGLRDDMDLDLLKIDCEGCELDVLGNVKAETLKRIRYITGERHNSPDDFKTGLGARLESLGFATWTTQDPLAHSIFTAIRKG